MKTIMQSKNKKGQQLWSLYGYILAFILIAILLGVGLLTLSKISTEVADQSDLDEESYGYTSINTTIEEVGGYADYFGIIVIVTVAAIIIGIVVGAFVLRRQGV